MHKTYQIFDDSVFIGSQLYDRRENDSINMNHGTGDLGSLLKRTSLKNDSQNTLSLDRFNLLTNHV